MVDREVEDDPCYNGPKRRYKSEIYRDYSKEHTQTRLAGSELVACKPVEEYHAGNYRKQLIYIILDNRVDRAVAVNQYKPKAAPEDGYYRKESIVLSGLYHPYDQRYRRENGKQQ